MTDILLYLLAWLRFFFWILYWCIIIDVILSWITLTGLHIVIGPLNSITRPLYDLTRKYLPTTIGMLDLAPIILIIIIDIANNAIIPQLVAMIQR